MDPLPGQIVADRFEVDGVAGAGAMGVVYRARDRHEDRMVALKLLRGVAGAARERFAREAELIAELDHPGIVKYVAHGHTREGEPFLALEWLEGDTLAALLARQRRIHAADVIVIGTRIAEALGAAHARGAVHRDLKPANLFIVGGDLERIVLLDFGVARWSSGQSALTAAGTVIGTPGYMAPEQARGETAIDARADVFALGCVLFRCLTGRPPFIADDLCALLAKIVLEDAPSVADLAPETPVALSDFVTWMLSKEPEARPSDGRMVAAALGALEAGEAARARTDAPAAPPAGLTNAEQRVTCIVLTRPVGASQGRLEAAAGVAQTHGGAAFALADGSMLVTFDAAMGPATDRAASAARAAIALRGVLGPVPTSLASGRGAYGGPLPMGEVIDRAAALLTKSTATRTAAFAGAASGAAIVVDDVSASLVESRFDVRTHEGWLELVSESDAEARVRTLLGRPVPCVGRERELHALLALYDECVADPRSHVALVTAPVGVGKSRLLYEMRTRLEAKSDASGPAPLVVIGRGEPTSVGSPFGLVGQILRRAAGLSLGEPEEARRRKLGLRLRKNLPASEASRVAAFLGEIAGARFADDANADLRAARRDAALMGDRVRRAWLDFLVAECAAQPVVLALEDLQWADTPSIDLVDAALYALAHAPLFVMAFARPEVRDAFPKLWADRGVEELRLVGLTKRGSERLVRAALGDGADDRVVERIVERAGGNAFYLEELVRAVANGRKGALPQSVIAMVEARLADLDAPARRLLRAASVFGQAFWASGAVALLGEDVFSTEDHQAIFDELEERELVAPRAEARFPGEREYAFRHGLVRDAAYGSLTDEDRTLGHRLAAAWLERAGEAEALILAEHWDRGGEPVRAAHSYARAAEQALEGNDLLAAIAHAERGRTALERMGRGGTDPDLAALILVAAEARSWRGEFEPAARDAELAMRAAEPAGALWWAAAGLSAVLRGQLGRRDELLALAVEMHRASGAARPEVSPLRAAALARAAAHLAHAGMPDASARLLALVDDEARRDAIVRARLHAAEASLALLAGDVGAYRESAELAARSFDEVGDRRNAENQRVNAGHAALELGDDEAAERILRDALAGAERMGLSYVAAAARHNLGLALLRRGALDEAKREETAAILGLHARGDRRMEGAARTYLAAILAAGGDLSAAEREARLAVELLADAPVLSAEALATLAAVLRALGRPREALAQAKQAVQRLSTPGLEGREALVRLEHVETLLAAGYEEGAREALGQAHARLMERASRLTRADWQKSFLERVPEHARTVALAAAHLTAD